MKNFKKVLALVLSFVLALSSMSFAFAADVQNTTNADTLKALGLFQGTDKGYELDATFTRAQGATMILRLMGKEAEAKTANLEPAFEDVKGTWSAAFVAFAAKEGLVNGTSETTYAPNADMTAKQWLTLVLRALGEDGTAAWENTAKLAVENKLVADEAAVAKTPFLRDDMVAAGYNALSATVKGKNKTLLAYLVEDLKAVTVEAAEATKLYTAVPAVVDLKVGKITATNLKTFAVEFTTAIDKDTASKVEVDDKDVTTELAADGKTVLVSFNAGKEPKQSDEIEVKVNGVKSVDGKQEIKDFKQKVVVNDKEVPELKEAFALNAKQIKLTFSEPVDLNTFPAFRTFDDIKLNDNTFNARYTLNAFDNTVVLTLPGALEAKTHTIEVSNVADFAGFKIAKKSFEVVVAEDKTAPEMKEAEVKSIKIIEVTFDETLDEGAYGDFKVNGTDADGVDVVNNSHGTKFTVTLKNDLDLGAAVQVKIEYKGQKDVVGNEVKDWKTLSIKAQDDTTIPTATVEVKDENEILVKFAKVMLKEGKVTLLDKDGKEVAGVVELDLSSTGTWENDNKELKLSATTLELTSKDPEKYTLVLKDMKDASIRKNAMPETKLQFTCKDTKAPTVTTTYYVKPHGSDVKKDTVTFYFSEAMDETTIKSLANYHVAGSQTFASRPAYDGAKVELDSVAGDKKSVTFKFPNAAAALSGTVTVYALKDAAGNMIAGGFATVTKKAAADTVLEITDVKATGKKVIEVTFNNDLKSIYPGTFKVQVKDGVNWKDFAQVVTASIEDGVKAKLTLNKELDTFKSATEADYRVVVVQPGWAKNIYDIAMVDALKGTDQLVKDGIKPTASVESAVYNMTTSAVAIKIEFSENLKVPASAPLNVSRLDVYANNKILAGYTYSYDNKDGDDKAKIVITFTATEDLRGKSIKVVYSGEGTTEKITDSNDNELENFDATKGLKSER